MESRQITITLSSANAWALEIVAAVLQKPMQEVASFCLSGSTNQTDGRSRRKSFLRRRFNQPAARTGVVPSGRGAVAAGTEAGGREGAAGAI